MTGTDSGSTPGSTPAKNGPDRPSTGSTPPIFDPTQLVGRTFLMNEKADGQQHRARIVDYLDKHDSELKSDPDYKRFRVTIDDDDYEDLLTYQQVMDYITTDENDQEDIVWKFRRITGHSGPLTTIRSKLQRIQIQPHDQMGNW